MVLAIAGALASTSAFAQQSSVTVYGVIDTTFDFVSASGATNSGHNISSFNRVSANSSYLGFKGTEDLGDGLKALFQIESSIGADATGGTLAARDSYGALSGGFGTVKLGNLSGPSRILAGTADVNAGATGVGTVGGVTGKLGGYNTGTNAVDSSPTQQGIVGSATQCGRSATCASILDNRLKNSIMYTSPALGAFSLAALYSTNENRTRDNLNGTGALTSTAGLVTTTGQLNTKTYDLGATYAAGPVWAGATYYTMKVGDLADTQVKIWRLAGKYDFGRATLRGFYESAKGTTTEVAPNGSGDLTQKVLGIGGTFNVTSAGQLIAQYYKAAETKGSFGASNTGARLAEIGYQHSLSKRTMLKAVYARLANDSAANYDFGVNSVGVATTAASGVGAKLSGLQMGLRTTF